VNASRITHYALRFTFYAFLLVACTARATPASPASPEAATAAAGPSQTPRAQASATATLPAEVAVPTVSTEDPLRFVFPTSGPAPVSGWRPPQMPVPLSLRPEDHFWFARPIAADRVNWPHPFYRYGSTYFGLMSIHAGVDLDSPIGTPVYAAGPGVVVWAGYGLYGTDPPEDDPYGLAVAILHDFGYRGQALYTVYGHMSKIHVWVDQHVETGDLIGEVGETGNVTGPHLHFEVRLGKNDYFTSRNPELWLAPPQGWGVLAGRIMDSGGNPLYGQAIIVSSADGRNFFANSYGPTSVNSDEYYQENMVIGDLPAGVYTIRTYYAGLYFTGSITIRPGLVSYAEFWGLGGFDTSATPPPPQPTPTATP
jgi:murein DD-endopeptidase MepM/ murein hydrolase activator NlpD